MPGLLKVSWMVKPLSLFAAMVMSVWPLPPLISLWRPDWVVLFLLFWAIHDRSMRLWAVWLLGVVVDVQTGDPLGMHCLSLTVVVWGGVQVAARVRVFSLWQTSILVAMLDAIYRLLNWVVLQALVAASHDWSFFWPVLTSALVWPVLLMLMRYEGVRL